MHHLMQRDLRIPSQRVHVTSQLDGLAACLEVCGVDSAGVEKEGGCGVV